MLLSTLLLFLILDETNEIPSESVQWQIYPQTNSTSIIVDSTLVMFIVLGNS